MEIAATAMVAKASPHSGKRRTTSRASPRLTPAWVRKLIPYHPRSWSPRALIQQLHVLESKAAVGTEQLRVAELRWEERKRGFSFGVVTERQLREHKLAREGEIDTQKRKGYDLLTHYLRTIAFMGGDPLTEGDALLN